MFFYIFYIFRDIILHYACTEIIDDFVDWIHNDKIDIFTNCWDIKKCDRLSILIELSIIFAVNNLIEYLIYKIEEKLYFMPPEYVINLWLLSQELGLNILRDVSFAFCLDRFADLPLDSIYELSKENFLKLIGNVNITSTKSYLRKVTKKWMDYHNDFTIPLDILKNKETKILHSIVSCENFDSDNTEKFIHCWDGNNFFELTSFKYPKDILNNCENKIVGMEIIGRRYNIYLCGGTFDNGIVNKNIWRYSLISKKWFLETIISTERWHCMTAAFVKNKLILVLGCGKRDEYPGNVDIYDIYTGLWTSGAKPPCHFYSRDYTVLDDKLIICKKFRATCRNIDDYESYKPKCKIYIYFSNMNVWKVVSHGYRNPYLYDTDLIFPEILFKTAPCYLTVIPGDRMFLRVVNDSCNKFKEKCKIMRYKSRVQFKLHSYKKSNVENSILHFFKKKWFNLYFYSYYHDDICTAYLDLTGSCYKNTVHMHSFPIKDTHKFQSCIYRCRKFFCINHPNYLYN